MEMTGLENWLPGTIGATAGGTRPVVKPVAGGMRPDPRGKDG